MSCLFALALTLTDPAPLLGGPEYARGHTHVVQEDHESAYTYQSSAYGRPAPAGAAPNRVKAGDPVQLDDGFFRGPLAGGVGSEPPRLIVVRQSGHYQYRWR